jgi:hypothetical protein
MHMGFALRQELFLIIAYCQGWALLEIFAFSILKIPAKGFWQQFIQNVALYKNRISLSSYLQLDMETKTPVAWRLGGGTQRLLLD